MAGKGLKDKGANAFERFEGKGGKGGDDAKGMQSGNCIPDKSKRTERLYFKVTPSVKGYLQRASWENSTISRRMSMTDYVSKLVEDDMQNHPEWVPTDDELEGE